MNQTRLLKSITKTLSNKWFDFGDNPFGVRGKYKIVSITKNEDGYVVEVKLPFIQRIKEMFNSKAELIVRHQTYRVLITNDETIKQKLKVFGIESFDVKEFE